MLLWVFTFESTNFFRLMEYRSIINNYEEEIELYQQKIVDTKLDIEKLKDPDLLEKFAREEYYMKKDGEVIFVYQTN